MVLQHFRRKLSPDNDRPEEARVEDFIPYACHYDEKTVLTKNGELMQVIKVTGFTCETVREGGGQTLDLREVIRRAVVRSVDSNRFALWLHTLRRPRDLSPGGHYPNAFAKKIHDVWCDEHDWTAQYINEVYITVMIDGHAPSMRGLGNFFRNLWIPKQVRHHLQFLEASRKQLGAVVDGIVEQLSSYGAHQLQVLEENTQVGNEKHGIYYSEILAFLGKIINLKEVPLPLGAVDLSRSLPTHRIAFGFNALEVRGDTGVHFGAIFSVKEYHEIAPYALDAVLQLPQSFIITESFDFIDRRRVKKKLVDQERFLRLSGDRLLAETSGVEELVSADQASALDYGEHQIVIMTTNDSLKQLDRNVGELIEAFHELGVVLVREDMFMEDCYWAQMPGNFPFIKRASPIATKQLGGYASLYNFPAGKLKGNMWGDAITVFRTVTGTPYFFNFHYQENGHSLLVGNAGSGKTMLLHFLLCEAQKSAPRTYYLDCRQRAKPLLEALEGQYHVLANDQASGQMLGNPLQHPLDDAHRAFLVQWFALLMGEEGDVVSKEKQSLAEQLIEVAYALPQQERDLSHVVQKATLTEDVKKPLKAWHGKGQYAALFDHAQAGALWPGEVPMVGVDVTMLHDNPDMVAPVMLWWMYALEKTGKHGPAMHIFGHAAALLQHPLVLKAMLPWMQALQAKQALALFTVEQGDAAAHVPLMQMLTQACATQIYLPFHRALERPKERPVLPEDFVPPFGLTLQEYHQLEALNVEERTFLLKHGEDTVVATLNLAGMQDMVDVLAPAGTKANVSGDAGRA